MRSVTPESEAKLLHGRSIEDQFNRSSDTGVPRLQFLSAKKLHERLLGFFHVEDAAFLLIKKRAINNYTFEAIEFQRA